MLRLEDLEHPPEGFLKDLPEGGAFYESLRGTEIEGCHFGYFAVYRDDRLATVAPYFVMDFHLNTLLPNGALKTALSWIKFRLGCIGNPTTDYGQIEGEVSEETLTCIQRALSNKARLLAFKGFPEGLPLPAFVCAKSLPVPVVSLDSNYFSSLKSDRRNLLKRKLKKAAPLRYEEHDGVPAHLLERVYALYLKTWQKADIKFERLTPDYFAHTAHISKYLLFFEGDTLIGFTQLIGRNGVLVNRYVGLDYERSDAYGLYFAMFVRTIEYAVRERYREAELGATSYEFKRILGARQVPTWNYFRHTNPLVHRVLTLLKGMFEPSASELR
ncbi:GNAT family N-acetyltransferase [Paraburkholderia sp. MMS20-SJTR3]|uniref:GNAT family N-acetyltransferase n=1 Tax=Paraburkholderia sejongensis TaxID=2886946 RepID=A0ABS8K154_9BURK|nr:GNAT family N-acetyltransferase [Paraburkholderia sp. MMS20-SJTR3]MCC8395745.1 GNAT family N-acetyltransferase [Paraburkholderia sp. MMS20-SJTR3]